PAEPATRAAEAAPVAPAVPAARTPQEILAEERSRVRSIQAMGERLRCEELADQCIEDGRSLEDFITAYQEKAGSSSALETAEQPVIGMSEREIGNFSFLRLINYVANPHDAAAREAAAFELEASQAAQQASRTDSPDGRETVPLDVLRHGRRDLNVGTAAQGGDLVATDLLAGSFIEMLRNAVSVMQAGATMLTDLNGNIAIPRQTSGATGFWVEENGDVTESTPTFDQIAMTPKTVGALVEYSRQFMLQSSIDAEAFVRRDIILQLALAIDLAALNGPGTGNQPRGILQTSGIGLLPPATNGAAPTWSDIVKLETEVASDNALLGNLAYLTNTKVRGKLKETEKFAGGGREIWAEGNTPLNGYRAVVSNQVPSNLTQGSGTDLSANIFGNWADLIIAMWGGLDLLLDPYTGSASGKKRIVAHQSTDVNVRHPQSFAADTDIVTT
ncbi:MAG: phage major capsid protein, partial [Pseudomonadota bacterium]